MPFIRLQSTSIVMATAGAVLVGLATGCNRQSAASSDQTLQQSSPEAPAVKVVHPQKKDVRRLIERPGYNIEAYERTALYAKIAGYVLKWNVDMGDSVHKDDVLVELYIPEMEVELKQKEAAVRQATSEIEQAEAAKLRATAALKYSESQYERLARAGRSGVLDKEQVDESRFSFEAAQAAVAKAEADVNVAKARLEVAKADRDHVQTLLQYTKVRAPFDGIVTGRRRINVGDFVQPASASKGESLFVVESIQPVRVFVNVQELEAAWVRDGDVAVIRVQSLHGQQVRGTVTRRSKSLHPVNRTLSTQIDLPNHDGKLLPGMFVNATIIAERKSVWALPANAVVTKGDQTFCYRVENGKAVRTLIQVGLRGNEPDNELVEAVKKQTKAAKTGEQGQWEDFSGEEAIIAEPAGLADGQAVSVSSGNK
jgi:multidrug efflux pump subunit AcrA (membrane-fusion protein)